MQWCTHTWYIIAHVASSIKTTEYLSQSPLHVLVVRPLHLMWKSSENFTSRQCLLIKRVLIGVHYNEPGLNCTGQLANNQDNMVDYMLVEGDWGHWYMTLPWLHHLSFRWLSQILSPVSQWTWCKQYTVNRLTCSLSYYLQISQYMYLYIINLI